MSASVRQYILALLEERQLQHNYRSLQLPQPLIDFTSNDYLGFARDATLQQRVLTEIETHLTSFGSTGSRLLSGNSAYAEALEKWLADFHQSEAALLFNSGYTANFGLLSSLPYRGDTVFFDELVHASIHDGIRASKAQGIAFKHNDVNDLEAKLKMATGRKYVVVESLYSMDGDLAPLKPIAVLCRAHDAGLIVDEAHATGIMGQYGEGRALAEDVADYCLARIHTFGKAVGGQGAVVLGSEVLKQFLINYCRPFIYSTALPLYALAYIRLAYQYLGSDEAHSRRALLFHLIGTFRHEMQQQNRHSWLMSETPVQSVSMPGNAAIIQFAEAIRQAGFDVRPIKYPTVALGNERIRICLHSFNTEEEVRKLVRVIQSC